MAPPLAPDPLRRDQRQPVVLVVDDDAALCAVLREALSDEGYRGIAVATRDGAIAVLRSSAVALVIADSFSATADDLFPPTADLRAAAGDTPVALLTGYPIEDDAARAAGFVGVIAKPFELEDLVARVRRWTRGGEA